MAESIKVWRDENGVPREYDLVIAEADLLTTDREFSLPIIETGGVDMLIVGTSLANTVTYTVTRKVTTAPSNNGTEYTVKTGTLTGSTNANEALQLGAYNNKLKLKVDTVGGTGNLYVQFVVKKKDNGGDLVDDTTPQLGGDLDTNGHHIDNATGNLELYASGTKKERLSSGTGNNYDYANRHIVGPYFFQNDYSSIVAYAGGGQASAKQITNQITEVATVATAGDSVKLPSGAAASTAARVLYIVNTTANACDIFPYTDQYLNGTINNSISLAGGGIAIAVLYKNSYWQVKILT